MREDDFLATRVKHHKQKITLFFSSMRYFASAQPEVYYERFRETAGKFEDRLTAFCQKQGATKLLAYEPADLYFKNNHLEPWSIQTGIEIEWLPNPMFLTDQTAWGQYANKSKRRLMGDFYQFQRKRLSILVDSNGQPLGGKWSFDEDNRKSLPKNILPPPLAYPQSDKITSEVIELVNQTFPDHPGDAKQFAYPVNHQQARDWLRLFLEERLELFGDYEDAIPQRERTLFHSVLTPMLNIGLLTPAQIVEETLKVDAPLNSKEGFIRQIIGWREFIFWMSREVDYSNPNHFGFTRKLKSCWYDGTTGLPPVDTVIHRCQNYAYAHHIERLMIIGSVMLMSEIDPSESYRWFMEMFIDSADWVMGPNVLGMSQFADGGYFATKPYISGSAYILKMSDYQKGPWCEVWDGLYWRFVEKQRALFERNPRMSMMVRSLDKLDASRKERIFTAADQFIDSVTTN